MLGGGDGEFRVGIKLKRNETQMENNLKQRNISQINQINQTKHDRKVKTKMNTG